MMGTGQAKKDQERSRPKVRKRLPSRGLEYQRLRQLHFIPYQRLFIIYLNCKIDVAVYNYPIVLECSNVNIVALTILFKFKIICIHHQPLVLHWIFQ